MGFRRTRPCGRPRRRGRRKGLIARLRQLLRLRSCHLLILVTKRGFVRRVMSKGLYFQGVFVCILDVHFLRYLGSGAWRPRNGWERTGLAVVGWNGSFGRFTYARNLSCWLVRAGPLPRTFHNNILCLDCAAWPFDGRYARVTGNHVKQQPARDLPRENDGCTRCKTIAVWNGR